jgi:hypothetical protein
MEKYTQLKKLIGESDLHPEEKEDLAWLFAEASEEEVTSCLNLFADKKDWIKSISDNYQLKRIALLSDDAEEWKKIVNINEPEKLKIIEREMYWKMEERKNEALIIFNLISRHLYIKANFSQHSEEKSEQQQMREDEEEERRNEDEEREKKVLENLLSLAYGKNTQKVIQKIEEPEELPSIPF